MAWFEDCHFDIWTYALMGELVVIGISPLIALVYIFLSIRSGIVRNNNSIWNNQNRPRQRLSGNPHRLGTVDEETAV